MLTKEFSIGSQVKIIKDGEYEGIPYTIGEVWDVESIDSRTILWIEKDGKRTKVCTDNDNPHKYGVECIPYTISKTQQENYNIY